MTKPILSLLCAAATLAPAIALASGPAARRADMLFGSRCRPSLHLQLERVNAEVGFARPTQERWFDLISPPDGHWSPISCRKHGVKSVRSWHKPSLPLLAV